MMPITTVSTITTTITTTTAIVSRGSSDNVVLYVYKRMIWLLVCNANVFQVLALGEISVSSYKSIVFG
jgi:hypothetical protein